MRALGHALRCTSGRTAYYQVMIWERERSTPSVRRKVCPSEVRPSVPARHPSGGRGPQHPTARPLPTAQYTGLATACCCSCTPEALAGLSQTQKKTTITGTGGGGGGGETSSNNRQMQTGTGGGGGTPNFCTLCTVAGHFGTSKKKKWVTVVLAPTTGGRLQPVLM